jgi:hypothetical protein
MHIDPNDEALLGVAIGALLASLGGLLSGRFEQHLRRREREQSAAQLFGEILAALKLILRLANDARGRGEPYGAITLRFLKAAQRETQIYDRNRETLFDVQDPGLRARTHLLLLQISLTLDSLFELTQELAAADLKGDPRPAEDPRDAGFGFLMELDALIPPLLAMYETIARQTFDAHDAAVQQTLGPRARATQGVLGGPRPERGRRSVGRCGLWPSGPRFRDRAAGRAFPSCAAAGGRPRTPHRRRR